MKTSNEVKPGVEDIGCFYSDIHVVFITIASHTSRVRSSSMLLAEPADVGKKLEVAF